MKQTLPKFGKIKFAKGAIGAIVAAIIAASGFAYTGATGGFDQVSTPHASYQPEPAVQSDVYSDTAVNGFDISQISDGGFRVANGGGYAILNDDPDFDDVYSPEKSFEKYAKLDKMGRCGPALASIGRDIMPTTERGDIHMIHPTGWQSARYDFVDGESLYNRCHLIAYKLAGENANERNLITGTRQMNIAMQEFEDEVYQYVKETGNHVLYRVTPWFNGKELVARGVQMEARSVEDNGRRISYNVFIPNIEDGVVIDYATGDNWLAE